MQRFAFVVAAFALVLVGAPVMAQGLSSPGLKSSGTSSFSSLTMTAADSQIAWPVGYYSCNSTLCYTNNDYGCAGSGTCNLGVASHEWNQVRAVSLSLSGGMVTTREFVIDKVSSGISAGTLLATGTNYSGYKLPQAWTVTHLSMNVTTASTATVANTVFTITDGTNTCTATFACNTVTNSTGVKDVAVANGAGTGCSYPSSTSLTISVTTQGCATAATVNSITTWGKPQ